MDSKSTVKKPGRSYTIKRTTHRNKPTIEQLERRRDEWNRANPPGTPVTRYKLINPLREPMETKTRSEAWVIGNHSVVVLVEGVSGGVLLESLKAK
jgi:hypothetical protein